MDNELKNGSNNNARPSEITSVVNRSRPMKKRKLLEGRKMNEGDGKIGFGRIGEMNGERWLDVKPKPDLYKNQANHALVDRKKNENEDETVNGRKKKILRVEPSTISLQSHPKSETSLPIKPKVNANSDRLDLARMNKAFRPRPSDRGKTKELEKSLINEKGIVTAHGISRPRHDSLHSSNPSALSNLQSLLPNRVQVPSISDFLAQSQAANYSNTDLLASHIPLSAIPNVGIPQSTALDLLRQQEEQLALLRHLSNPNPMIDSLYREQIQLEQAKALLAGSQSSLHPLQQQAHILSPYAQNIDSLLAQQQSQVFPGALHPLSQQAQLALLSSQLDPSLANLDLSRAWTNILSQRNNELDLPLQGNQIQTESNPDDNAALLMAYQQGKYQSGRKGQM